MLKIDVLIKTLNKNESLILNHLIEGNQFTLDELSSATTLSVSEIMSAVTLLELNNFVRKNANGKFEHYLKVQSFLC